MACKDIGNAESNFGMQCCLLAFGAACFLAFCIGNLGSEHRCSARNPASIDVQSLGWDGRYRGSQEESVG